ncbi:MAG: GNAT family N-acetyltransferase [Chloroflexota bacterium]|nr:GNAT family N-acetyltransferase [Chloroflexota bacterium]
MIPPRTRPATEDDMPAIVNIYIRAYAQPPWNERHEPISSEGYLRWVMGVPETSCLLALDTPSDAPTPSAPPTVASPVEAAPARETVAGFVLAGARAYDQFVQDWERLAERPPEGWPAVPGTLGYIWEIAVDPATQRRGHGTALLAAAIERLKADGVDVLILRSSERATAAIGLYHRFGFQRLPVRERIDPLSGPWVLPLNGLPPSGPALNG